MLSHGGRKMTKNIAVLIIHGMGVQNINFAKPTMEKLDALVKGKKNIIWQPIYWANITQPRQTQFMDKIIKGRGNHIHWRELRKFVISSLGDATAYQRINESGTSTYDNINKRVGNKINDLFKDKLKGIPCPLVVMAHSLGGHIISSYIWDIQKERRKPKTNNDFEHMRYLGGMITFGCNIPLFTFAHDLKKLTPIEFPGDKLKKKEKENAAWLNFYDADDILGYPLKQVYPKLKPLKDIHINAGNFFTGWLTSWNPLSHNNYWTDNDMLKQVAKFIVKL